MSTENMSIITPSVQKTLFEKMSMLERGFTVPSTEEAITTNYKIGDTISDGEQGTVMGNYMLARSTWMRMVSMKLNTDGKPVILQGGESDENGRFVSNLWGSKTSATSTISEGIPGTAGTEAYWTHLDTGQRVTSLDGVNAGDFGNFTPGTAGTAAIPGEPITNPEKLQHGRYWTSGENQPFRPGPGLKDIRVEHRTLRQAAGVAPTRTTEINWICWTWQELDRLTKHFLTPTAHVFVDWGWMGGPGTALYNARPYPLFAKNDNGDILGFKDGIERINKNLSMYIVNQRGHYDAIVGQVYNFDWKVREDGGFDCTTQIMGRGSLTLDTLNTIGTDHLKAQLPSIISTNTKWTYELKTSVHSYVQGDPRVPGATLGGDVHEQRMWILPVFAAEQFFKDHPENKDGKNLWEVIMHETLTAVARSTDEDRATTRKFGHIEVPAAKQTQEMGELQAESGGSILIGNTWSDSIQETKGGTPVSRNDEVLGAAGIEIIDASEKNIVGGGFWATMGGQFKDDTTITANKFLWMKSDRLVTALSPWITFDDYLEDMWNQVFEMMLVNPEFISSGNVIGLFGKPGSSGPWGLHQFYKELATTGTYKHLYVTWGWFEDNVITRFFGEISKGKNNEPHTLATEFRSYEDEIIDTVDLASKGVGLKQWGEQGGKILYDTDGDGEPDLCSLDGSYWKCNASGIAYGDPIDPPESDVESNEPEPAKRLCKTQAGPFVITTDTSKFLLVDKDSMINKIISEQWIDGWKFIGEFGVGLYEHPNISPGLYGDKAKGFPSTPCGDYRLHEVNPSIGTSALKYFRVPGDEKSGIIRNVYFNVDFLRSTMREKPSIGEAVLAVWKAFSNEYGGIFQFGLKNNDTGSRTMVTSTTWAAGSVSSMLDNKSHRKNPGSEDGSPESVDKFDGLFEFPTWKKGSMVKSQNLAATLPDALKRQLSLQTSNPNPQDDEKTYDAKQLKAKGMAHLVIPSGVDKINEKQTEDMTEAQTKKEMMYDALSGEIQFPHTGNRWFGLNSAKIGEDIKIGVQGAGIQLTQGILDSFILKQSDFYMQKLALEADVEYDKTKAVQDQADVEKAEQALAAQAEMIKNFLNKMEPGTNDNSGLTEFYEFLKPAVGEEEENIRGGNYLKLNSNLRGELNGLLRGPKGPVGEQDPIVPIDFDMDIDGIGGIFPGNAFASNYLPSKYKALSCFQTSAVEQRVDSSNWTTTIKGQIRVNLQRLYNPAEAEVENFTMQGSNPLQGLQFKPPADAPLTIRRVSIPDITPEMVEIADQGDLSNSALANSEPEAVVEEDVAKEVITDVLNQDEVTEIDCGPLQ
jgi:hypothetical protein